jgi:hypothetical protein
MTADAPMKFPLLFQTDATTPLFKFFDTAASTFILITPSGEALHLVLAILGGFTRPVCFLFTSYALSRSHKKLIIAYVEREL